MDALNQDYSCLEVSIIEAEIYHQNQDIASSYSVTVIHSLTRFQTPVFPVNERKIQLESTRSFCLNYEPNSQNKGSEPFLRILLNPTGPGQKLQALIEQRTLAPWMNESLLSLPERSKKSFCLSYPLICRSRNIAGEIKLSFGCLEDGQEKDCFRSSRLSQKASHQFRSKQPKKLFSTSQNESFSPCVSRRIAVKLLEPEPDYQSQKCDSFANQRIMHQNLQYSELHQVWKLSNEELPVLQPQEDNLEGDFQKALSNSSSQNDRQPESQEEEIREGGSSAVDNEKKEELPEDYRHLFHKITEINKKYAPLERIPSQEELSQGTSFHQKDKEEQSFYSINSELSFEETGSLAQAQEFLKELNLYKFGRSLTFSSEPSSQNV